MNEASESATPGPGTPWTPPPRQYSGRPPLTRSRSDRRVAGVAGGVAAYLGIDPLILRIVIVVLTLFGGSGLLLYAAGWLLIPNEGEQYSEMERIVGRDRAHGPSVGAVLVTIVGLIVLVSSLAFGAAFGGHWWFGGPDIWPLLVVGAIVALVWYSRRDRVPLAGPYAPPAPGPYVPPAGPSAGPPAAPVTPTATSKASSTAAPPTATLVDVPAGGGGMPPTYEWAAPPGPPPPPPAPLRRRERSVLGAITWWVTLVAAGVMFLLDRTGAWHLLPVTFFAVLLGVVGLGLVVGSFAGRSRGLIALGVLLSLVTSLVAAVPAVGVGRTGTVTWVPTSVSASPSDGYSLAAGKATLDLSAATIDDPREVQVQLGAGRLLVIVPAGVRLVLHADVGVGTLRTPDGRHDDGIGRTVDAVYGPSSGSGPTLTLRVNLGFGNLEVRYA